MLHQHERGVGGHTDLGTGGLVPRLARVHFRVIIKDRVPLWVHRALRRPGAHLPSGYMHMSYTTVSINVSTMTTT